MPLPWLGVFKYLYQCHCTGWEYFNIYCIYHTDYTFVTDTQISHLLPNRGTKGHSLLQLRIQICIDISRCFRVWFCLDYSTVSSSCQPCYLLWARPQIMVKMMKQGSFMVKITKPVLNCRNTIYVKFLGVSQDSSRSSKHSSQKITITRRSTYYALTV